MPFGRGAQGEGARRNRATIAQFLHRGTNAEMSPLLAQGNRGRERTYQSASGGMVRVTRPNVVEVSAIGRYPSAKVSAEITAPCGS
jgi:hypothetical protein